MFNSTSVQNLNSNIYCVLGYKKKMTNMRIFKLWNHALFNTLRSKHLSFLLNLKCNEVQNDFVRTRDLTIMYM
jgi:hypothetical protein